MFKLASKNACKEFISLVAILMVCGCAESRFVTILVVDDKTDYSAGNWDSIREHGFRLPHTIKVSDEDGRPIQLYRVEHGGGRNFAPVETNWVHISTPIIVERKHSAIMIEIVRGTNELGKLKANLNELRPVRSAPVKALLLPVTLP